MILLGLGSNLGDRKANLEAALRALGQGAEAVFDIRKISSVYESAALLPEGAPAEWDISYYNIVVAGESDLTPLALLQAAKAIEQQMGRQDMGRWGPRLIDIDILAHGDTCLSGEALTLPHAHMLQRDFVLLPLLEICREWQHPDPASGYVTAQEAAQRGGMALGAGLSKTDVQLDWRGGA